MKKLLLFITLITFASMPYIVQAEGHHKHHHKAKKKHHKVETDAVVSTQPQTNSDCDRLYAGKPVKFNQGERCSGGGYFGGPLSCDTPWFDGEIVGVSKSNGLATARAQGQLIERNCSEFK